MEFWLIHILIECLFYVYFGLWCCIKYKESTWPFQFFHKPICYKVSKNLEENQANNKEFNLLHYHLKRAPFLLYALLWVIFSDLPKVVPSFHKVFLIFVKVHASVDIISNFFLCIQYCGYCEIESIIYLCIHCCVKCL